MTELSSAEKLLIMAENNRYFDRSEVEVFFIEHGKAVVFEEYGIDMDETDMEREVELMKIYDETYTAEEKKAHIGNREKQW